MNVVPRMSSGLLLLFLVITLSPSGCGDGAKPQPATPAPSSAGSSPGKDAETYPVKLFVPAKVGQQRIVDISAKQILDRTTVKGDKLQDEKKSVNLVEFKAKVETLAVNPQGQETKRLLTIEKLALTPQDGKTQEGLPAGFVLTAETVEGRTVYQPREKDQKLGPLAEHLLPRIYGINTGATDDQMFPIAQPQKIGATWPANKKLALAQFKGIGTTTDQLHASATLVGVKVVDGKKMLELEMAIRVETPGPSEPELVSQELTVKVIRRLLIPADFSSGPIEEHTEVTMKHVLQGKPGSTKMDLLLEGSSTDTTTRKTTYLK